MSAFDRLQNYSAKRGLNEKSEVFDITTPEGAFLNRVHQEGYSMYETVYTLKESCTIDEESYNSLSDDDRESYDNSVCISETAYLSMDDSLKDNYVKSIRFTELHDALISKGNQVINAIAGSGKALTNSTKVLTSGGYRSIGDIKVGDKVYGEDGQLHDVLGVYPQGRCEVYRVHFSDDNYIDCNLDHLWTIEHRDEDGVVVETVTTETLMEMLEENGGSQGVDFEYIRLPKRSPVAFGDGDYKINLATINNDIHNTKCTGKLPAGLSTADLVTRMQYFQILAEATSKDECDLHSVAAMYTEDEDGIGCFGEFYLDCDKKDVSEVVDFFEALGCAVRVENLGGSEGCIVLASYSPALIMEVEELGTEEQMTCIEIDSPNHLYLTEHCIPTHNTTSLVLKILHDIVTGEAMTMKAIPNGNQVRVVNNMWVCTFLRSGASELEQALTSWQRKLGYSQTSNQITFSTMDAEFKRCLNSMGVATPIGDPSKLHGLLTKAVNACNVTRKGYPLNKEDYQIISGIVTYYRGRLDNKRYQHPSCQDYDLTPKMLEVIVNQYANLRQLEGIMDFEEIMELLYKYLYETPNPAVQDFVANRYNFIYIDEFQDTSQMAYAILKFYGRGHLAINKADFDVVDVDNKTPDGLKTGITTLGKVVVVGDPSQCYHPDTELFAFNSDKNRLLDIKAKSFNDGFSVITPNGNSDAVTGLVTHDVVDETLRRFTTDRGSVTVTLGHKFFKLAEFKKTVRFTVLYTYLGSSSQYKDSFLCQVFDDEGVEHSFESPDSADAYLSSLSKDQNDFEYFYNFRDRYYQEVAAVDIKVDDLLAFFEGDLSTNVIVPNRVWGYEDIKYTGKVVDINTDKHVYVTSSGLVTHNCIYSFRGSDSHLFTEDFMNDFEPIVSHLSVNWRCPANILNPIVPSIHTNSDSATQLITAAGEGGEFVVDVFASYKLMVNQLKYDLRKDMDDNYKVAILCRTNFDGLIPAFVLESEGVFDFGISGENMTLNSPLPKKIIGVTSLFTERSTPAVKNALEFFMPRNGGWKLKQLMDVLKLNQKSIWQLPEQDLEYSCHELVDFVKNIKKIFMPDGVNRDKSMEIEALRAIYIIMIEDVFDGDSAYCESARAYLETLLYIMENNDFKTIYDFLEGIDYLNDKLQGRIKKSKAPIQIATVHEFKGKERDSVYIWNDSDGTFPSSKCDLDNIEQVEEERRVHYIAGTRAKKREHIYSLVGKIGTFLREMDCKYNIVANTSATLPKHEAVS